MRVAKYLLYSALRPLLGRSSKISYAHTGEDRIIESLLKKSIRDTGFYVDVGCNHPTFISNTFSLYRKGWKGICIDGNERLIKKFSYLRPRDKAVHAVVSDQEKELEFIKYTNDVLSSVEPALEKQYVEMGQQVASRTKMNPQTLTQILDTYKAPQTFDLLSVDAEDHDLQVLRSLNFAKYKPTLVVTEIDDFDLLALKKHPVFQLLASNNYKLEGYVLKNAYFKRS